MSAFTQIVGCIAMLGLVAAIVIAAVAYALEVINHKRFLDDRAKAKRTIKDVGQTIKNYAHWFTEDEPTWAAIEKLGEGIAETGELDISAVREKWRNDKRVIGRARKS